MQNFNKLINLKLVTGKEVIQINTPKRGCKPDIEISGSLTMASFAFDFEVRVTNFYSDAINDTTEIIVSAGYEGKMSAGIAGQVQAVYTESPAPDKITVLSCKTANYDAWVSKTINLKLDAGFALESAVAQIKDALGFESYSIDEALAGKSCPAPLAVNGRCSEAIAQVKKAFPGTSILTDGKKLKVFPADSARRSAAVHNLAYLTQAPQFSGGEVSITAPWEPMVKPGDYVHFPTTFSKADLGAIKSDTAMVNSIQFRFATNGSTNEMILSCTTVKALKEGAAE